MSIFSRIPADSPTRHGGFWIREADVRKMKYRVTDYLDILRNFKLTIIVIKDAGLNLMDVPDRRGKKVIDPKCSLHICFQ